MNMPQESLGKANWQFSGWNSRPHWSLCVEMQESKKLPKVAFQTSRLGDVVMLMIKRTTLDLGCWTLHWQATLTVLYVELLPTTASPSCRSSKGRTSKCA